MCPIHLHGFLRSFREVKGRELHVQIDPLLELTVLRSMAHFFVDKLVSATI